MLEELIKGQPLIIAVLLIAVFALSGVVVYLYKQNIAKDKKLEEKDTQRYQDLKDFVDSYKEPIAEIGKQQKGIYELFASFINAKTGK